MHSEHKSHVSIKARMLLLVFCTVGVALTITCVVLLTYNFYKLRRTTIAQLQSQAQMLAFNSENVLSAEDAQSAEGLLACLQIFPSVESAWLINNEGQVIATYPAGKEFDVSQFEGVSDKKITADGVLLIRQPISQHGNSIGTLVMRARLENLYVGLRDYVLIVAGVMLFSLGLSAYHSMQLKRAISTPIAKLVTAARKVTEEKDYSTRVRWNSGNELGHLCSTFDLMLDEIQAAKDELQKSHDDLEIRVAQRTSQLTAEIEQRERVAVELEAAKDAAISASTAKSEFLANMSHEIRTPLNGVLGFTELLTTQLENGDSSNCRDYLKTIQTSGKHLLILINDILDISKIEAGQLEVEQIPCSPHEVITQVTSVLRSQAQAKGLDLQYRWASHIPDSIVTDPARLRQLLMNLVGNAVKFTETGFVCITARVDVPSEELAISIEDTGLGISAENCERIFEPFVQADNSVTRRFGGTGLGLAISRRLANAMGGDLEVSSEEGRGSCFTARVATGDLQGVQLRTSVAADAVMPRKVAAESATDSSARLTRKSILVVEDGATNRKLVKAILEEAGATVTLAENGQVGFEVGRAGTFDAILMDMQMPVMDGYTSARKLREAGITIPIVGLTAHAMPGDRERCMASGCCGYLTKPIEPDKLLYYLASRLDTHRPDGLPGDSGNTDRSAAKTDDTNCGPLKSSLPTEKPIYAEIVCEFAAYAESMISEMEEHLQNTKFEDLAKLAHSLKGSGGSAGFQSFTDPAKRLEQESKHRNEAGCRDSLEEIRALVARIELPESSTRSLVLEGS